MKRIVIIGAGVAGLSAGCYARMNGYDSEIFEMQDTPGGVCTSWRRGEYLFDHCLHWVLGSNEGSSLYPVFVELGIPKHVEFYHTDRFRQVESKGKTLTVYTDVGRFENELLRLFPAEERAIRRLMRLVRFYTRFRPPLDADFGRFGLIDMIKMLPYVPSFLRLVRTRTEDFFRVFRDEDLREMLLQMFPVADLPALMAVMPLAYFHNHEGGYPLGGSLHFARVIERRYLGLGGKIRYGRRVTKILVQGDKAVGIETEEGERVFADIVISACDGRTTLYGMLDGRYLTSRIGKMYSRPRLWPPIVSISLGVDRDLTGEVEINSFRLEEPVLVGGRQVSWLGYFHYCRDRAFAPVGKSVIEVQIESDYEYWRAIHEDGEKYEAEKRKVLGICLRELEKKLPGLCNQVETVDIATPVTWERYTGNWRGSYEGWLPTVELFGRLLPRELPRLRSFYMTGQWISPGGGVPMCMVQARRLIEHICRRDKRKFVVETE